MERVRNPTDFREAILYFMLFDPAAAPATDPRPALDTGYLAPGLNRLFSRSSWGTDAAWFTYGLSWNSIDHQMADGNSFAFYRDGEWLTKGRVGYANIAEGIASSEFYNTIAVQNDRPADHDDDDWRIDLWRRGSQWNYVNDGDPALLAVSSSRPLPTPTAMPRHSTIRPAKAHRSRPEPSAPWSGSSPTTSSCMIGPPRRAPASSSAGGCSCRGRPRSAASGRP